MTKPEEWRKKKERELKKKMSYPEEPVTVTDDDFDSFVSKHEKALVDLWADWCAPCKQLAPVLEEMAGDVDAAIGKIDVDKNQKIPSKYNVTAVPTMLLFKDGEVVDRLQGLMPEEQIREALEKL